MPTHYPLRQVLSVAPALVAVILVACGRSPLDASVDLVDTPDAASAGDDSGGLPTKPTDDGGLETKDAGLGTKDAGLGTKDSGLGTEDAETEDAETQDAAAQDAETPDTGPGMTGDAGSPPLDAGTGSDSGMGTTDGGPGTVDSGTGTTDGGPVSEDSGTSEGGTQDAGAPDAGGVLGCFACAEERCGKQVNACLGSSACVEEGTCDLACLGAPFNPLCFGSCAKNQRANQELLSAVSCAFTLCPQQCLSVLTSSGGIVIP
jgi:hypothetical protein